MYLYTVCAYYISELASNLKKSIKTYSLHATVHDVSDFLEHHLVRDIIVLKVAEDAHRYSITVVATRMCSLGIPVSPNIGAPILANQIVVRNV